MNVGSLFSGIGGMDYGLHASGHRHVFFCESDPWRREVLAARWPGVPIYDDVARVGRLQPGDGRESKWDSTSGGALSPDLLCGGFPCQDVSVAGRRAGLAGNRSGLFFEFARIIDALRPRWVLIENVPGLLSSNGGRDFGTVLGTLADLGYGVGWRVLDSRFFGVPQRRRRVFIVGTLADGDPRAAAERAGQVLAVGSRCPGHPPSGAEKGQDVAGTLGGGAGERGWAQDTERMTFLPVAHSLMSHGGNDKHDASLQTDVAAPLTKGSATGEGVKAGDPSFGMGGVTPAIAYALRKDPGGVGQGHNTNFIAGPLGGGNDGIGRRSEDDPNTVVQSGVRRLTPRECERLQGLPDDWTLLNEKTPDSRRYSALGDAVTVPVSAWIGGRL